MADEALAPRIRSEFQALLDAMGDVETPELEALAGGLLAELRERGRRRDWPEPAMQPLLDLIANNGNVTYSCGVLCKEHPKIGVSRRTVLRWREKYPEFDLSVIPAVRRNVLKFKQGAELGSRH